MEGDNSEKTTFEELHNVPVKVVGVQFIGLERTKSDILEPAIQGCLSAQTFSELTHSLASVSAHLSHLELFKQVRFIIDQDDGSDDGVVIRAEVKERRCKIHAGTEMQRNEIGFGAGGTFYNVLGRAEKLDINASIGTQSATPLAITFSKPVNGNPFTVLNLSLFSTLQHYIHGSFKNRLHGFSTAYTFSSSISPQHEVKYALDWRHIFGISEDASLTIRRSAGHDIKSSLSHTMTWSTRDCNILPSTGYFSRITSELAGLGGSAKFLKNNLITQVHLPLYKQFVMNMGIRAGYIFGLTQHQPVISILDKYQQSGPLSIRGFALNSLGPKDRHDSIGGDLQAEASIGFTFPLTSSTTHILRGHLFANAGILTNMDYSQSFYHNMKSVTNMRPNVSIGSGLQIKLGEAARLELNVSYPLSMQPNAIFHRGMQVGLGVEFL